VGDGSKLFATASSCPRGEVSGNGVSCKSEIIESSDQGQKWSVQFATGLSIDTLGFVGGYGWATASVPVGGTGCATKPAPCTALIRTAGADSPEWELVDVAAGYSPAFLPVSGTTALLSRSPVTGCGNRVCEGRVSMTTDGGRHWTSVGAPRGEVVAMAMWPTEVLGLELVNIPGGARVDQAGVEVVEMPLADGSVEPGASLEPIGFVALPQEPAGPGSTAELVTDGAGDAVALLTNPLMCGPHGPCYATEVWTSDYGDSWSSNQQGSFFRALPSAAGCPAAYSLSASPDGLVAIGEASNVAGCGGMPFGGVIASDDGGATFGIVGTFPTLVVSASLVGVRLFATGGGVILSAELRGRSAGPWHSIWPPLTPVNAINWVSQDVGFGFGSIAEPGATFVTLDGGASWSQVSDIPADVIAGSFVSRESGYAVALTLPLGVEVSKTFPPSGAPASVLATAPLGRQYVIRTTDGGVDWVVVSQIAAVNGSSAGGQIDGLCPQGALASLQASPSSELFLGENPIAACLLNAPGSDQAATTWVSSDDGSSFSAGSSIYASGGVGSVPPSVCAGGAGIDVIGEDLYLRSGFRAPWEALGQIPEAKASSVGGVQCLDARTFAVEMTGFGNAPSALFATTDAGRAWREVVLPAAVDGAVSFSSPNHGMVFGNEGDYLTSDVGATWRAG